MISKSPQNMAILNDNELKFTQNMNEMPKNFSLEKSNCDNLSTQPSSEEDNSNQKHLNENSESKNCDDSEMKTNNFPSETRIQLSFSVDRLLSNKLQQNKSPPLETHSHDRNRLEAKKISDKCCDNTNVGYSCCLLPNCRQVNSSSATCKMLSLHSNSYSAVSDEDMMTGSGLALMDYKSIVRPTPVRAMGSNSESVPTLTHFSSLSPTSFIRFHHVQIQQQKQLAQHLPAQPNFNLSSLMSPLCGLKPLQINAQQTGMPNFNTTPPNRFSTKVNFEIPVVRPNLTCIPALRHHHLTSPNSNETRINFSTTTTTTTISNTTTVNTNPANSHGNLNSGKRKRSWSRAVFSNLQRKGLEIQFQQQKYITKPDRRKLAARLNLTDAQVKVWFQNRRMKWRHTRENLKSGQEKQPSEHRSSETLKSNTVTTDLPGYSSDGSSSIEMSDIDEDDNEIDVVE